MTLTAPRRPTASLHPPTAPWPTIPCGARASVSCWPATHPRALSWAARPTPSLPGVATNLIVLHAFAADDGVVTNVTFYQDSLVLGTLTNSPYDLVWTNYAPGNYNLSVVATDNTGLVSTSAVVNVTLFVPNYPPAATVQGPTGGTVQMSLAPSLKADRLRP